MAGSFREFKHGWPVVVASMIGIGLGMSPLPFYTLIHFSTELAQQFGWEPSTTFLGLLVFTVCAFFAAPLVGNLTDKFGVRRVVLVAIPSFSFTFMLFALNNGSLLLYLVLWAALAFAGAGTLPITFTRAVNGWFTEKRGLALGVALLATGVFGGFALRFAQYVTEAYDWRTAYIAIASLPLIFAWPAAFFLLRSIDDPKVSEKAKLQRAQQSEESEKSTADGMTFGGALRDWRFWVLAYVFVPVSVAIGGPIPAMRFILQGNGFGAAEAVTIASYIGFSVLVGRLTGGYLIDRIWAPGVAFVMLILPVFSLALLAQGELSTTQAILAMILLGVAAGVEYDLLAFLVSKYFGMRSYGAIYGALYGFFAIGAGLSPFGIALAAERLGGFTWVMWGLVAFLVVGILPILTLGRYRKFNGTEVAN